MAPPWRTPRVTVTSSGGRGVSRSQRIRRMQIQVPVSIQTWKTGGDLCQPNYATLDAKLWTPSFGVLMNSILASAIAVEVAKDFSVSHSSRQDSSLISPRKRLQNSVIRMMVPDWISPKVLAILIADSILLSTARDGCPPFGTGSQCDTRIPRHSGKGQTDSHHRRRNCWTCRAENLLTRFTQTR